MIQVKSHNNPQYDVSLKSAFLLVFLGLFSRNSAVSQLRILALVISDISSVLTTEHLAFTTCNNVFSLDLRLNSIMEIIILASLRKLTILQSNKYLKQNFFNICAIH